MSDIPDPKPPMPRTPPEALGPSVRETVIVEGRTFTMQRPSESDLATRHPAWKAVGADYVPYWADLWPAARMLAKEILKQQWPAGTRAIEIGCGLGLPGVVALAAGLRVTFSDYDATALEFAVTNARLNGLGDFDTLQLDWRYPLEGVTYPLVLAADLIYEVSSVEPLIALIRRLVAPGGECLLADQDRVPSHVFRVALDRAGVPYSTRLVRAGEPGGRRVKGTLYRITPAL